MTTALLSVALVAVLIAWYECRGMRRSVLARLMDYEGWIQRYKESRDRAQDLATQRAGELRRYFDAYVRLGREWERKYARVRRALDPRGVVPEPPPGEQYNGPHPLRGISLEDLAKRVRQRYDAAQRRLIEMKYGVEFDEWKGGEG